MRVSEVNNATSLANAMAAASKAHPSLAHIEKRRPSVSKSKNITGSKDENSAMMNSRDVASNVDSMTPVERTISSTAVRADGIDHSLHKNGSKLSMHTSPSKSKMETRANIMRRSNEQRQKSILDRYR